MSTQTHSSPELTDCSKRYDGDTVKDQELPENDKSKSSSHCFADFSGWNDEKFFKHQAITSPEKSNSFDPCSPRGDSPTQCDILHEDSKYSRLSNTDNYHRSCSVTSGLIAKDCLKKKNTKYKSLPLHGSENVENRFMKATEGEVFNQLKDAGILSSGILSKMSHYDLSANHKPRLLPSLGKEVLLQQLSSHNTKLEPLDWNQKSNKFHIQNHVCERMKAREIQIREQCKLEETQLQSKYDWQNCCSASDYDKTRDRYAERHARQMAKLEMRPQSRSRERKQERRKKKHHKRQEKQHTIVENNINVLDNACTDDVDMNKTQTNHEQPMDSSNNDGIGRLSSCG